MSKGRLTRRPAPRSHLFKKILPRLREAGVPQGKIDTMLVENPRRYFASAGTARC